MKAAVLNQLGNSPVYKDFQEPVPENDEQILIHVKAAAIKNIDKLRASGNHYASYTELPTVVGIDGVGVLENGTRVYAQGITGMVAEKAIISKNRYTVLPDQLDFLTAAALPNAVLGAAMALRFRAEIKKGDTVLINGATGVTGQLAVQIARFYGAAKIIATGRNKDILEKLKSNGVDAIISLKDDDETIIQQLTDIHNSHPIDIVLDYVWGQPIALIITALTGGELNSPAHKVRIVSIGSMAGENITLSSGTLRSSAIELLGSGLGSFSKEDFQKFNTEILPEMFQLAAEVKLTISIQKEALENIETLWDKEVEAGKRMVICM